jgi:threonine/homoserine/homoserine lactone efflux protein
MEPGDDTERQRRGSCLAIVLTGGLVGLLLLLLILATGGWAVHIVWITAAILGFGGVHYLLWGRTMLQQTAGEREEEEVRRRAEERERQEADPHSNGVRRFH